MTSIRMNSPPPYTFDLREHYPDCSAFTSPFDQGACNGCAAASLATLLSILACISPHAPNSSSTLLFSAQQIWDCYDGSCEAGVPSLDAFFETVLLGPKADLMLQQRDSVVMRASNFSLCTSHNGSLNVRLGSAVHHMWGSGEAAMQAHIMQHGPVLAVMTLPVDRFQLFSNWRNTSLPFDALFYGSNSLVVTHALVVTGWVSNASGTLAWRVQNSMGDSWGDHGHGLIMGAPLHQQWYSFSLVHGPQTASDTAFALVTEAVPPSLNAIDDGMILCATAMGMLGLGVLFVVYF